MRAKTQDDPLKRKKGANKAVKTSFIDKDSIVPAILLGLYVLVEFVPEFGANDVMGPQWLYLCLLNILCIVFFLIKKTVFPQSAYSTVFRTSLTGVYVLLFIVAGISIFGAINSTESLVCYARFTISIIAFFNLCILLYQRMQLFSLMARIFSLIAFIQAAGVMLQFFRGYANISLPELILGIKGNAGNKNILAASLAIKLPFLFYCIHLVKGWGRIFYAFASAMCFFAIAILNARASYISTSLAVVGYIIFCILRFNGEKRKLPAELGFVIVPFMIGILLSQLAIRNALQLMETTSSYGTLGERLSSIRFTTEGTSYRALQWSSAYDYIKGHPFQGAGYGNWKLASIPYEKSFSNNFLVTYHVHNDFLEMTAEAGWVAGLLLVLLFLIAAFYAWKAWRNNKRTNKGPVIFFSAIALMVYFIDAFFNFPSERPVMQFFFGLVLAWIVNLYLDQNKPTATYTKFFKPLFIIASTLLLVPSLWLVSTTFSSMQAQKEINPDFLKLTPEKNLEEVEQELPDVPNLNSFCFPVDAIKASYLLKAKRYEEALQKIDKAMEVNPYLPYPEYLKSRIFEEQNQLDSAKFYALKALDKRPRALPVLEVLNYIYFRQGDTAGLSKSFAVFTSNKKDEPGAWNDYIRYLHDMPHDPNRLQQLVDSAVKLFPENAELKQKQTNLLLESSPGKQAAANAVALAKEAFTRKNFDEAIRNFKKAADLDPGDYRNWENLGVCYYNLKDFSNASRYFERALLTGQSSDGKPEFFKGICLLNLGEKTAACEYFEKAKSKQYPGAEAQINSSCH